MQDATITEFNEKNIMDKFRMNKTLMKRLKWNHNTAGFSLLQSIVTNFLNLVNVYNIKIDFPWAIKPQVENLFDWCKEMLETMLMDGIAGYRCIYLPFYRVRLVTSADELDRFLIEDETILWVSTMLNTAAETFDLRLPTVYGDGHRPRRLQNIQNSEFWMFHGPLSALFHEHELHRTMGEGMRMAVINSSYGLHTRTVDLSKMEKTNVMQVTRLNVLENANLITEKVDAENEDLAHMIRVSKRLNEEVENPPDDEENELLGSPLKKPKILPPSVTENVIYPPKIIVGAAISYEENIRNYVLQLVNNSLNTCINFMQTALQGMYDNFLQGEVFYNTYLFIYLSILDDIEKYLQKKERVNIKRKKSVPYFRNQIVAWMRQNNKMNIQHMAFFQTLTPDSYDKFMNEISVTYGNHTYTEMEQDERIAIILDWIRYEIDFCKAQIEKYTEGKATTKANKKKEKEKETPDTNTVSSIDLSVEPISFSWKIAEIVPVEVTKVKKANDFINQ